jgi:hypothetical protein
MVIKRTFEAAIHPETYANAAFQGKLHEDEELHAKIAVLAKKLNVEVELAEQAQLEALLRESGDGRQSDEEFADGLSPQISGEVPEDE